MFEADEDLYQTPSMSVVLLTGQSRSIPLSKQPRSFQSYVNEMCGLLGLASNTLRFQTEKRDVPASRIMAQTCLVKVNHSYEFHQSPNKSLRPSLEQIYTDSISSDLTIVLNSETKYRVNKCIVAVRSAPLARLIMAPHDADTITIDDDIEPDLFELLVRWLYFRWLQQMLQRLLVRVC